MESSVKKTLLPHHHGEFGEQLAEHMPSVEEFEKTAQIFKLLSDPGRIRIFWLLCHCEECGIDIAAMVGMTGPAAAHHLRLLKEAELIVSRRDGKEVYYRAADTEQANHLHLMIEKIVEIGCPQEETRLKRMYLNEDELISEVHKLITENLSERYTIEELSKRFLINTSSLKTGFKRIYEKPIGQYMKEFRLKRAKQLLEETDDSIADIAESVGYESQGKFTAAFRENYGLNPSQYRTHFKDKN